MSLVIHALDSEGGAAARGASLRALTAHSALHIQRTSELCSNLQWPVTTPFAFLSSHQSIWEEYDFAYGTGAEDTHNLATADTGKRSGGPALPRMAGDVTNRFTFARNKHPVTPHPAVEPSATPIPNGMSGFKRRWKTMLALWLVLASVRALELSPADTPPEHTAAAQRQRLTAGLTAVLTHGLTARIEEHLRGNNGLQSQRDPSSTGVCPVLYPVEALRVFVSARRRRPLVFQWEGLV
jgi:hypothetical protein